MSVEVEVIRDRVAEEVRRLLREAGRVGAQVGPLGSSQLRVTYRHGGFRLLDVGGLVASGVGTTSAEVSDESVRRWTRTMLMGHGEVPDVVPIEELAPTVVGDDVPEWVVSRPVGDGLREAIGHGEGYLGHADLSAWEVATDPVFAAVRGGFAERPFEPRGCATGVVGLESDDWTAAAWAFYPTALKVALGVFDAPTVVFLPDSGHLFAASAADPAATTRAGALAREVCDTSPRPLTTVGRLAGSRRLETYPDAGQGR